MGNKVRTAFSQDYIRKCFDAWYLANRPNLPARIKEVFPVDEFGRKPSLSLIKSWMIGGVWDMWADEITAKAMVIVDDKLVNVKAKMLIKHQQDAMVLADKALEYLKVDGFDSSAAAVNAYFKATEEQRKTAGFSDLLEKLDKMSNNDVEKEIIEKLRRIQENDQIVEGSIDDTVSGSSDEE